jgi:NAD(P)H-hydrate repair Nnr-like enzyme with NAD(P)H-hydrate dehydratase domain
MFPATAGFGAVLAGFGAVLVARGRAGLAAWAGGGAAVHATAARTLIRSMARP